MADSLPTPASSGRRIGQRLLVAVVVAAIVAAVGYLSLIVVFRIDKLFIPGQGLDPGLLGTLPGVDDDNDFPDGRVNILVLGLDRRPHEGDNPTRTDTMFVVTIDPRSKTAGILGIPRDLWVEIPFRDGDSSYQDRVNTVYVVGEQRGDGGGGVGLLKKVAERNLGITIDHHLLIDFEGFIEIIDSLGGIEIYVPDEINDPTYSRTEIRGDFYPLHFEVGLQRMDGQTALDYSRTRYGTSDLDRIQRQQRIIFAAIDKALDLNLVQVGKMVDLWGDFKDAVDTDINDYRIPGFARLAAQIDPVRISARSLGAATVDFVTPQGASVLVADKQLVAAIVADLFSDQQLLQEEALVQVQNSAGQDGLAEQVIDYLAGFGFPSGALSSTDNPQGSIRPLTEIIDYSGKAYTVGQLADLLGVPPDRVRAGAPGDGARPAGEADIVVILGADAQDGPYATEASSEG